MSFLLGKIRFYKPRHCFRYLQPFFYLCLISIPKAINKWLWFKKMYVCRMFFVPETLAELNLAKTKYVS